MRKQYTWVIACLALTFAGDRLAGYFLNKISEKSQFRYSRLYNRTDDAEILFVGNSRGLTFFQPEAERLTTQTTMNLSYNGMPADLAKCLVMDYYDRHAAPKLMIIDVTLCDRENDVLKSGFNMFTPQSKRLDTLLSNMNTNDDAWAGRKIVYGGKLSHLYRFNSEVFQRVLYHRKKTDKDWLIDRVIGQAAMKDTSLKSYQVRYFPNMVSHLKEMVAYAEARGTVVKLVINPYYQPFADRIRDSFLIPLKTAVETETGLPVQDFSTALTTIDEIGDYQHANKKGSIHYMNILAENGILKTHNSNTTYANAAPQSVFTSEPTPVMPSDNGFSEQMTPSVYAPNSRTLSSNMTHNTHSYPINSVKRSKIARQRGKDDDEGFAVDTMFSR